MMKKKKVSVAVQFQSSALLHEDIISNILTRLPVKYICQFKCVCKSWLSIISARPFVNSHSARSKSQPKLLVTVSKDKYRYVFITDIVQHNGTSLVLRQSVKMPTMPVKRFFVACDIPPGDSQSVGGLIFSFCSKAQIKIANPSTNKCVAFSQLNYISHQENICRYISLGFDPIEGKHKILESLYNDKVKRTENRVITVGDDANCWRHVKDGPSINRGEHSGQEICINGVIYFAAWVNWASRGIYGGTNEGVRCIVAFDVRTESFQAVELSMKGRCNYSPFPWIYAEFEGKLAVVDYPLSGRECCSDLDDCEHALELWVLEDFENQVWNLKFAALPPLPMKMDDMIRPKHKLVGTTLDGKLIFAAFEMGSCYHRNVRKVTVGKGVPFSFLFYDMKTGDFRSSEVRFPEGFALTGKVRITAMGHVETLLSI